MDLRYVDTVYAMTKLLLYIFFHFYFVFPILTWIYMKDIIILVNLYIPLNPAILLHQIILLFPPVVQPKS